MDIIINSLNNAKIKSVIALNKAKERKKTHSFTVEGIKMIDEVPSDWKINQIFVSEQFIKKNNKYLDKFIPKGIEIVKVSDQIFKHISDTVAPQGIKAVVFEKKHEINDIINNENPLIIMVENLQDPGNLGTIIRTADAVNADGIILSCGTVELYNPKVIRSTMGSIFHLPIVCYQDLNEVIPLLKEKDIMTFATHLKGSVYPYSLDLTKGCAMIIGNEGNGISDEIANKTDMYVKIPMLGKAESLNAAMAAGIVMYEAVRQRIE